MLPWCGIPMHSWISLKGRRCYFATWELQEFNCYYTHLIHLLPPDVLEFRDMGMTRGDCCCTNVSHSLPLSLPPSLPPSPSPSPPPSLPPSLPRSLVVHTCLPTGLWGSISVAGVTCQPKTPSKSWNG